MSALAAPDAPDFVYRAFVREGNTSLVSLQSTVTGAVSWQRLGSVYHGYRLLAIDPHNHSLTVKKSQNDLILPLTKSDAQASPASAAPAPATREDLIRRILANRTGQPLTITDDEAALLVGRGPKGSPPPDLLRRAVDISTEGRPKKYFVPFDRSALPPEVAARMSDDDLVKANEELIKQIEHDAARAPSPQPAPSK